ncbi:MAG: type II toxin-antitoxin system HicB family antitoxin [Nitrospira sp.]|nr:type II toxin-antitoxin system HicB family antitoxin [bacterium]MBL7050170.1 type II toxin-antitoxin system HicB family antitoxin [Nitrospira sp.]
MKFNVVLDESDEGGYDVTVPALDGCCTQGDTLDEALENAKEAIMCYLEGLEKLNEIKSDPNLTVREVEIAL